MKLFETSALIVAGATAFALSGCVLFNDLPYEHTESLELEFESSAPGFDIELEVGDIEIVATEGTPRVTAVIHEKYENDAHLVVDGDITLELPPHLGRIGIANGVGDIDVSGFDTIESLRLESGTGDVHLSELGEVARIEIELGVGDAFLVGVGAMDAKLECGVGDAVLERSSFAELEVDLGVGDLTAGTSEAVSVDLDSGVGDIVRPRAVESIRPTAASSSRPEAAQSVY
ncbi:MAG: DUF4097 family beta strand repeat-containing protein [Planctomycetota bacterium]|jgi:hypothetical protein